MARRQRTKKVSSEFDLTPAELKKVRKRQEIDQLPSRKLAEARAAITERMDRWLATPEGKQVRGLQAAPSFKLKGSKVIYTVTYTYTVAER